MKKTYNIRKSSVILYELVCAFTEKTTRKPQRIKNTLEENKNDEGENLYVNAKLKHIDALFAGGGGLFTYLKTYFSRRVQILLTCAFENNLCFLYTHVCIVDSRIPCIMRTQRLIILLCMQNVNFLWQTNVR